MIWNYIIIDIVDFTHKEISIYCLMSFQVLKKRNLIFISFNGHRMNEKKEKKEKWCTGGKAKQW